MEKAMVTEEHIRIVGYLSPTYLWAPGKKAEFHDRKALDKGWKPNNRGGRQ